jgi:mRNA interferase HicA
LKRFALIQLLELEGCYLLRHGKKHDLYVNPKNGLRQPVPRHSEVKDSLVRIILRDLGIEKKG